MAFTGEMAKVLDKASRELFLLAKTSYATIRGKVTTLDRRDRIKITGTLQMGRRSAAEPIQRSLWVKVSSIEYDAAFDAQSRGRDVEASGQVTRTERRFELQPDDTGLTVI